MTSPPASPPFLPYGRQSIGPDDIEAVVGVLNSDWLTTGPMVPRFEAALAAEIGVQHVAACASGTAALHLALLALGIGRGDAVIVPSLTFLATANCARYAGAEVVFADVDADTGLMTPATLDAALGRVPSGVKARAAIPVHLRGVPCDLPGIAEVARRHGLDVVEDAAHALGSRLNSAGGPSAVGGSVYSRLTCFSFHPVKTIAMGEGGAVSTSDPGLAERLKRLRSHGIDMAPQNWTGRELGFEGDVANPWYYEMTEMGYHYRITDIQCALGLSQLGKLGSFVERRRALASRYDAAIAALGVAAIRPHASPAPGVSPAWHLYSARIDFERLGVTRATLMAGLRARGIGSQVHYIPVHRQPYYSKLTGPLHLPGADHYYAHTLSLPLFPSMADGDVDRVAAALDEIAAGQG